MSKDKEQRRPGLFAQGGFRAIRRRLVATKAFRSGEMERLRMESIERGAVPWKILAYRRIVDPKTIPVAITPDAFVTPQVFEEHIRYLSRECKPMRLRELITLIENNEKIPDRAVVVTIDVGHMDCYLNAFPILLKYQVPATVFLSTGYMESKTFLYDDRLAMCLFALRELGYNVPYFEFLGEGAYEEILKVSPERTINPQAVTLLVNALWHSSPEDRARAMSQLAQVVSAAGDLPDFEDFMRWNDARHMQEKGIEFGSMGHFAISNPRPGYENFTKDLDLSFKTLKEQEITAQPVYCFPAGLQSEETLESLRLMNCRYAVTQTSFPEPRFQTKLPMLLGRISMFQASSFCVELFAARLWELEIRGLQY